MNNIKETIKLLEEKGNELKSILDTMDVPETRKLDTKWLSRNLFIRNSKHPKFNEAMDLITWFLNLRGV